MRQVILGFNRLSLLEVSQLSRKMRLYTNSTGGCTEDPSDAEGCWWNIDHFVYSVSESLLRSSDSQQVLLNALTNLRRRAPSAQSTEYLRLLWAARAEGSQGAVEAIHRFIDRCGYGGARQTLGELYAVVLPFGELLIGQQELSSELHAVNKELVEEAMWTSLEWLSETGIAHSSWMAALASTNMSFASRSALFRRAHDLASRIPGGEFQMVSCALMLAVVHAAMPPTAAATPLLRCGTELSPVARAAHWLTLAKDAAGRIDGLGLRELASNRTTLVELYLHNLWGTAAAAAADLHVTDKCSAEVSAQEALLLLNRGEYAAAVAKVTGPTQATERGSEYYANVRKEVMLRNELRHGRLTTTDNECYQSLVLQGKHSEAYNVACRVSDSTEPSKVAEALLEKADSLYRGGDFVGALHPALESLAVCEPLALCVTAAKAALTLAKSIIAEEDDDALACDRALTLIESVDDTQGLLPPDVTAQSHFLRAKCLLRKASGANSGGVKEKNEMLQAAAGELGRALTIYESLEDYTNTAETCYTLAMTCNALGWTKLRDEAARKWRDYTTRLSQTNNEVD